VGLEVEEQVQVQELEAAAQVDNSSAAEPAEVEQVEPDNTPAAAVMAAQAEIGAEVAAAPWAGLQPAQEAAVAAEQLVTATASKLVAVATAAVAQAELASLAVEEPVAACKPEVAAEEASAHKVAAASGASAAVAVVEAGGRTVVEVFVGESADNILDLPAAVQKPALLEQQLDQKQA
jgi:hypothetical protein